MKLLNKILPLALCFHGVWVFAQSPFDDGMVYEPVDYGNLDNWAAHPEKRDNSDKIPGTEFRAKNKLSADVFFIHPTIYSKKDDALPWNPRIDDPDLNTQVDQGTILFQASAFNAAGKVFAPRYRQAHLRSFSTEDTESAKKAFAVAYKDVKQAFEHFLKYYHHGRPFIIASHSQGTMHAKALIKQFIDGKALEKKLVAAYLIGMPVGKSFFESITPCENADEVNCSISWRTYKKGHLPENRPYGDSILVTNPLSWGTDTLFVDKSHNLGAVLRNFDKILLKRVDAQVHHGLLWASKPRFPFSFLYRQKDYHIADINLYYGNIRENAKHRVNQWIELYRP